MNEGREKATLELNCEMKWNNERKECRNLSLPEWMKRRTNEPKARRQAHSAQSLFCWPAEAPSKREKRAEVAGAEWSWFVGGYRRLQAAGNQPTKETSQLPSSQFFIFSFVSLFFLLSLSWLLGLIGAAFLVGGLRAHSAIAAQAINPFSFH